MKWFRKPPPDPWIVPRSVDEWRHKDAYDALFARLTELRLLKRSQHALYLDEETGQHWFSTLWFLNHWSYFGLSPIDAGLAHRLINLPDDTNQTMVDEVWLDWKNSPTTQ